MLLFSSWSRKRLGFVVFPSLFAKSPWRKRGNLLDSIEEKFFFSFFVADYFRLLISRRTTGFCLVLSWQDILSLLIRLSSPCNRWHRYKRENRHLHRRSCDSIMPTNKWEVHHHRWKLFVRKQFSSFLFFRCENERFINQNRSLGLVMVIIPWQIHRSFLSTAKRILVVDQEIWYQHLDRIDFLGIITSVFSPVPREPFCQIDVSSYFISSIYFYSSQKKRERER